VGSPLADPADPCRQNIATGQRHAYLRSVNRSRDRIANLHRWLVAIVGSDLHWDNPRLNDALLETSFWIIGTALAIDPARLKPAND